MIATPVTVVTGTRTAPAPPSEWPVDLLDVTALKSSGWRPTALSQFVIKLYGRCNLRCSYCYVYEMADRTWRDRPAAMSPSTVATVARRVAEHARNHRLSRVEVVLHGGEPLLVGPDRLATTAEILRTHIEPAADLCLRMQSNGVLLTDEVLEVLAQHRVQVGVSLDGQSEDHDRRRRNHGGLGSHAQVVEALRRLGRPRYRDLFAGLLCTVHLENEPLATYEALLEFAPPAIDFLLPHGNWSGPPPGRVPGATSTPYAEWLLPIFDRWYAAPRVSGIRLFEEIISLALGGPSRVETIGLSPVGLVVVDTDGSLEQVDVLKSAYHGAAATGLNVFDHSFDRVLDHPAIAARQIGSEGLAEECQRCRQLQVCGGGYYPHRYRHGQGYKNPSVYCPDLFRLTRHIADRVFRDVRARGASDDDETPSALG